MKKLAVVLFAALLMLAWGPIGHASAAGKVVRITLIDENGSGEDGSAQLTDQGDGTTKVELIMMNAPDGAVQPAHIHKGTCTTLDPTPAYPLNNITDGKSTTVVQVSLTDLTSAHYAINVHKSAAEVAVYVSCGNLPLSTATSGTMTVAQAIDTLIDQANELAGQIKQKETDGARNAYAQYHSIFAANEANIKAQSATTQAELDDAMTAVDTALQAGDFDKAGTAVQTLLDKLNEAKTALGGTGGATSGNVNAGMSSVMNDLQSGAADLVRETGNKDPEGAQAAYTAFHTTFAAHEADLTAKAPNETAEMTAAQTEVQDALKAGNWTKAASSAKEIQQSVSDAMGTMGLTTATIPTTGNGGFPLMLLALAAAGLALLSTGVVVRRRATR